MGNITTSRTHDEEEILHAQGKQPSTERLHEQQGEGVADAEDQEGGQAEVTTYYDRLQDGEFLPGNSDAQAEATPAQAEDDDDVEATKAAQAKADELGVDLASVKGSGKDGRVTVSDVEAAAD
jgi:pyruvate/2-oxoglutarate dehydrogenase complex dihydrolipoamide acyltransferase (E2) component